MFADKRARSQAEEALRHLVALAALLIAKGVISEEELTIASQPILLAQSNDLQEYAKGIQVALAAIQHKKNAASIED